MKKEQVKRDEELTFIITSVEVFTKPVKVFPSVAEATDFINSPAFTGEVGTCVRLHILNTRTQNETWLDHTAAMHTYTT